MLSWLQAEEADDSLSPQRADTPSNPRFRVKGPLPLPALLSLQEGTGCQLAAGSELWSHQPYTVEIEKG